MKRTISIIVVLSFIFVGISIAAEESNLPKSNRTDKFTTYQETDNDDRVKALIGAERIPIVDNAMLNDPQFVGERPGQAESLELQKQTRSGVQSPNAPTITSSIPSTPASPAPVLPVQKFDEDETIIKYDAADSEGGTWNNGTLGERRQAQSPGTAVAPVLPATPKGPIK
jgi:hypothetical protein